uniref:C2H2-type domain-containing protein n=1 Tax=Dendroctonus ponderosae TaxID=77166 RepID=A0AAR5PIE0_DENPD
MRSPSPRQKVAGSRKLKQEVQTIIDIMGPPLCSNFNYNTSSEADNEESVFSNYKLSSDLVDKEYICKDQSENTDCSAKNKDNLSIAVDLNSSTSAILDELTDSQANFPYVESVYSNTQYICPPPSNPANICINSECFCPQVASLLHGRKNHTGIHARCKHELATPKCGNLEPNDDRSLELNKDSKNVIINWLKAIISSSKELNDANCAEYYRMNVTKQRGNNNSRPRVKNH